MRRLFTPVLLVVSLILGLKANSTDFSEPIVPLPTDTVIQEPGKVALGRMLFNDVRLSKNNSVSCSNCHDLYLGGTDGKMRSLGINGAIGDINSPTVFNSALNFRLFWNGRAKSLEDQVDGTIEHQKEFASNWLEVIQKLKKDKNYVNLFSSLYPDGLTAANVKNAIATFERALITPNSRFDRYLRGEKDVLTSFERKGYERFKSFGCIACHQGANVGGNMFQSMGVMGKYFEDRGTPITEADLGRYTVTKKDEDKHVFRVPSLRNVELTAPYFHDGSAKKLEDAVTIMAKYQLGRKLTAEETNSIAAFLRTLTGELPNVLKENYRKAASK